MAVGHENDEFRTFMAIVVIGAFLFFYCPAEAVPSSILRSRFRAAAGAQLEASLTRRRVALTKRCPFRPTTIN
jgi:hypothetical protein